MFCYKTSLHSNILIFLSQVLDGNHEAADILAAVVHSDISWMPDPEFVEKIPNLPSETLGIWIDPIGEQYLSQLPKYCSTVFYLPAFTFYSLWLRDDMTYLQIQLESMSVVKEEQLKETSREMVFPVSQFSSVYMIARLVFPSGESSISHLLYFMKTPKGEKWWVIVEIFSPQKCEHCTIFVDMS